MKCTVILSIIFIESFLLINTKEEIGNFAIYHIYIYILEDEKIKNMILKERIFCIFTLQLKGSS